MDSECDSEGKHCILFVFTFLTGCFDRLLLSFLNTVSETDRDRERDKDRYMDIDRLAAIVSTDLGQYVFVFGQLEKLIGIGSDAGFGFGLFRVPEH